MRPRPQFLPGCRPTPPSAHPSNEQRIRWRCCWPAAGRGRTPAALTRSRGLALTHPEQPPGVDGCLGIPSCGVCCTARTAPVTVNTKYTRLAEPLGGVEGSKRLEEVSGLKRLKTHREHHMAHTRRHNSSFSCPYQASASTAPAVTAAVDGLLLAWCPADPV
jgi:hypothetical protein